MDSDAIRSKPFLLVRTSIPKSLATPSTPNPSHHRLPVNHTIHLRLCHTPYTLFCINIAFFSAQCPSTKKNPFSSVKTLFLVWLGLIAGLVVSNAALSPGILKQLPLHTSGYKEHAHGSCHISTCRLRVLLCSGFPYEPSLISFRSNFELLLPSSSIS